MYVNVKVSKFVLSTSFTQFVFFQEGKRFHLFSCYECPSDVLREFRDLSPSPEEQIFYQSNRSTKKHSSHMEHMSACCTAGLEGEQLLTINIKKLFREPPLCVLRSVCPTHSIPKSICVFSLLWMRMRRILPALSMRERWHMQGTMHIHGHLFYNCISQPHSLYIYYAPLIFIVDEGCSPSHPYTLPAANSTRKFTNL